MFGQRHVSVMAVLCALAVFSSVWTTGSYTHDDTQSVSQEESQHQKAVSFMDAMNKAQAQLAQGVTSVVTLLGDGLYLVSRVTPPQSVGGGSLMTKGRDASSPTYASARFRKTFEHEVNHPTYGLVLGLYVSIEFEKTPFGVTPLSVNAFTRGMTRRRSPGYHQRITTWTSGLGGATFEISGSQYVSEETNGVFTCKVIRLNDGDVTDTWR